MIFPFVSRERYNESVSRLDKEVVALKAEREKLLDVIARRTIGEPIYAEQQIPVMQAVEEGPIPNQNAILALGKNRHEIGAKLTTMLEQNFASGRPAAALLNQIDSIVTEPPPNGHTANA